MSAAGTGEPHMWSGGHACTLSIDIRGPKSCNLFVLRGQECAGRVFGRRHATVYSLQLAWDGRTLAYVLQLVAASVPRYCVPSLTLQCPCVPPSTPVQLAGIT